MCVLLKVPVVEFHEEVELRPLRAPIDRPVLDMSDQIFDVGMLSIDVRSLIHPGQKR